MSAGELVQTKTSDPERGPADQGRVTPANGRERWQRAALAAALFLGVLVLYLPSTQNGFIWDDDAYVTDNPGMEAVGGLARIWHPGQLRQIQYYPLTVTGFWVEYRLWQDRPLGYHVVNVVIHGLDAVLLWLILRRLAVPGAWLAAALFAFHPVHVESVTWVSDLKNVLSGFFYLTAGLAACRFFGLGAEPARGASRGAWYGLALVLFVAALLSKTVTCSFPAVLVLLLWWKKGRVSWRDWAALVPCFAIGLGFALLTVWVEKKYIGTGGHAWDLSFLDRCLLAGRALWFYAFKLVWPAGLAFFYPRWQVDASAWWQYVFPLAALAVMVSLWLARGRLGRGPLVAVLFFAGTLVPALGFFNVYPQRYSFVADHFQYLASIGVLALVAAAVVTAFERAAPVASEPEATSTRARLVRTAALGCVLAALAVLTWPQQQIYRNAETLWRDTLAKNPGSAAAHHNLGMLLLNSRPNEARLHLLKAIELEPSDAAPYLPLVIIARREGNLAEAERLCREALKHEPNAAVHLNLGSVLQFKKEFREAAEHYETALRLSPERVEARTGLASALAHQGKRKEAKAQYSEVLRRHPELAEIHNRLGQLLAEEGQLTEAARELEEAVRLEPRAAEPRHHLAGVYLRQGRLPEALAQSRKAVELQPLVVAYRYRLADVLKKQGRAEEAEEEIRRARRPPDDTLP